MRYLFVFFLLAYSCCLDGQSYFNMTFGYSFNDYGWSVRQIKDGGFLFIGSNEEFDGTDFYYETLLVKADSLGQEEWRRVYNDFQPIKKTALNKTSDGGFVFLTNLVVVKIDSFGQEQWTFNNDSSYTGVHETADIDYLLTKPIWKMYSSDSVRIIKTNNQGIKYWHKTYEMDCGGNFLNYAIRSTVDGGYIMMGCTSINNIGTRDALLFKLDSVGDTTWVRSYGGEYDDDFSGLLELKDGGYLLSLMSESYSTGVGGYPDACLIRINSLGDTLWTRHYGGGLADKLGSPVPTMDGGYILTGRTKSYGNGNHDVWLFKIDSIGNEEWSQTFGGSDDDIGFSVQQTKDGGYIIIGYTESFSYDGKDIWLIKTDMNGHTNVSELPKAFNGENVRKLEKVVDLLGREVNIISNQILLYIYDDGSVDKKMIIE